jgi:enterochelin esterase-like enzyme
MRATTKNSTIWGIALAASLAAGCAGSMKSTRLEPSKLDQTKLGRSMEFAVMRAPAVEGVDPADLPVFLFLHGMRGDHLSLDRHGVSEELHQAMLDGRIPPAHLVLPDGENGYFVNWYDGSQPYEDYVLEDVLPAAEDALGVSPDRENRHVIGVSMGGQAALRIGLSHPELFASAASLSSVVLTREEALEVLDNPLVRWFTDAPEAFGDGSDQEFSDSQNAYVLVERRPPELEQRIFLAAGTEEWSRFRETSGAFAEHLADLGVHHEFVVYEGGHGWTDWVPVIEQAMSFATAGPSRPTATASL